MRALVYLLLLLLLCLPGWSQAPKPVPLSHQNEGQLFFERGSIQAAKDMVWVELPNKSKHPLYIAATTTNPSDPDLFYNLLLDPDVSSVDGEGAKKFLRSINQSQGLKILDKRASKDPLPGVLVHYQLSQRVTGMLILSKGPDGKALALMGEGRLFKETEFLKVAKSFKAGAKPPKEWESRVAKVTPSDVVKDGIAQLQLTRVRVPKGFQWSQMSDDEAQILLGQRAEPFSFAAISVVPNQGVTLTEKSLHELGTPFMKKISDPAGLTFRLKETTKMGVPVPSSYLATLRARTSVGEGLDGRLYIASTEKFVVMLLAAGRDDGMVLSTMFNSLDDPAQTPTPSPSAAANLGETDDAAGVLLGVSLLLYLGSLLLGTCLLSVINAVSEKSKYNPYGIAIKGTIIVFVLQSGVIAWLLKNEGAGASEIGALVMKSALGFALMLVLPWVLRGRWERRNAS